MMTAENKIQRIPRYPREFRYVGFIVCAGAKQEVTDE